MRRALIAFVLIVTFVPVGVSMQQGGTTRFVYDDNGRLRAVVSPTGLAAVYEYDPAGNFTAIRRLAANALELLDFFPKQGVPGDVVTFIGVGFGAGVNSVSFNAASAQVLETNNTMVTARVPPAATTGLVTINTPNGTVMTAAPFTIKGVRVDPATANIFPNNTVQFAAVVAVAGPDQSVTWSVDDVNGGNANVGTITTNGLYTAPNQFGVFIVRATSNADLSLFGESIVTAQNRELINIVAGPVLSVRRGPPPGNVGSAGVSVQRGVPPGIVAGSGVSVTNGPNISNVSPGTFAKGTAATITINGSNFGGATAILLFTTAGALDSNITTSGLTVSGDGASLSATVTVSGGAATGRRVVVISSSTGRSQLADLGTNTIEVVP